MVVHEDIMSAETQPAALGYSYEPMHHLADIASYHRSPATGSSRYQRQDQLVHRKTLAMSYAIEFIGVGCDASRNKIHSIAVDTRFSIVLQVCLRY